VRQEHMTWWRQSRSTDLRQPRGAVHSRRGSARSDGQGDTDHAVSAIVAWRAAEASIFTGGGRSTHPLRDIAHDEQPCASHTPAAQLVEDDVMDDA
jgi:hypothetical protein